MRSYTKILVLLVVACTFTCCRTPQYSFQQDKINYKVYNVIAKDMAIVNYYIPFKQELENEMNRVIGNTEYILTPSCSQVETSAGNFFTGPLLEIGNLS